MLHLLARDRRARGGSDGHPSGKLTLTPLVGEKRIEFSLAPAREGDGSRYVFSEIPAGEYRLSLIEEISGTPLPLVHPVETVTIASHAASEHHVDVWSFGDLEVLLDSPEQKDAIAKNALSLVVAGARKREGREDDTIVDPHILRAESSNVRIPAIPPGRYLIFTMGQNGFQQQHWIDVSDALGWRVDLAP